MTSHAGFENAADALTFITGGNCMVTLTSAASGKHFTFKVSKKKDDIHSPFFVKVLKDGNNAADEMDFRAWKFVGFMPDDGQLWFKASAKNPGAAHAPSFRAFRFAIDGLKAGTIHKELTIQHEGRCCMCNRVLTHPESIALGIGPECRSKGGV